MTLDELKELMETGEEFELEKNSLKYRFKNGLLQVLHANKNEWYFEDGFIPINQFLEAKIVRKPWKPKVGDSYFCWGRFENEFIPMYNDFETDAIDLAFIAFGNYFRTKEECESHTEIRDKLIEMRKEYI